MKRGRASDTLTGGTGDVNPQWWTLPTITMLNVNEFVEDAVPVPISRLNGGKRATTATVMEVLKVMFILSNVDQTFDDTFSRKNIQIQLSTSSQRTNGIFPISPSVFAYCGHTYLGLVADDPTEQQFVVYRTDPNMQDLTDGAGHGVLIAGDYIYLGLDTAGFAAVGAATVKILYRFKEVGITEYIGMVQSQSASAG